MAVGEIEVECNTCGATARPRRGYNLIAAVPCGCCKLGHDCEFACNACPGPAAHPECGTGGCEVNGSPCQGGHCGIGVPGCTVCRSVTIRILGPAEVTAG